MVLDFIEILKVIFLGIVEGITEWLPISSRVGSVELFFFRNEFALVYRFGSAR